MRIIPLFVASAIACSGLSNSAHAQATRDAYSAAECPGCAAWLEPQQPFRIYGNSYYVGTHGLAAILITSNDGHVLIDGGLPESAPMIMANIRALGFRVEDIKLILNSHAHYDHAGGIAAIQRASNARVSASPWSAAVLRGGAATREDPQYEIALKYPPVSNVGTIADGETVRVGPLALTAHFTPGHTPGGTSWTWRSCEGTRCLDLLYADSQTPVSADGFLFTRNTTYPTAIADFERGLSVLEGLPCDILLTPHPAISALWDRVKARDDGTAKDLVSAPAVRANFVANARTAIAARIATERGKP